MENENTKYVGEATQIDEKTVPNMSDEKTVVDMAKNNIAPAAATPASPSSAPKKGSDVGARAGIAAAAFGAGIGSTVLASSAIPDSSAKDSKNENDNDSFFDDDDDSERDMSGMISEETGKTIADIMEQDPDGYIPGYDSDSDADSDLRTISDTHSDSDSDDISVVRSHSSSWGDGTVDMAASVDDSMTFNEAFAAARAEVGAGGAFEWHGKVYNTFYESEWNNMTAAEKSEYESHFSWGRSHNNIADDEIPVDHQKSHIVDNGGDVNDDTDNSDEVNDVIVGDDLPVVEVLGVGYDEDLDANVGVVSVDGVEAVLLDVDQDETFDYLLVDENSDGEYSSDEVYDISDENLTVDDLNEYADAGDVSM